MYLNVYVPQLQSEQGVVRSFKYHRGQPLPSAALMCPLSRGFVAQLERFVTEHRIPLAQFRKREPKGAAMAEHLRRFADSLASVDSRPDTGQPLTHARRICRATKKAAVARFTTEVEMEQIGERTRSRGQLEQDLGPRRVPGGANWRRWRRHSMSEDRPRLWLILVCSAGAGIRFISP